MALAARSQRILAIMAMQKHRAYSVQTADPFLWICVLLSFALAVSSPI